MVNSEVLSYMDRVERLQEEISGLREDVKDIYLEAKSKGYNTKLIKQVIKIRKAGIEKYTSESDELDVYLSAAGLLKEGTN